MFTLRWNSGQGHTHRTPRSYATRPVWQHAYARACEGWARLHFDEAAMRVIDVTNVFDGG